MTLIFSQLAKKPNCQWGVSNVPPEMLEQMVRLCEEKGLQMPSCYQGDYNIVTRGMEMKLLPILRAHGMTFNAFRFVTSRLVAGWPFSWTPWRKVSSELNST